MPEQNKYKIKDIIILDDNKEYSIIKKVNDYYVLLSLVQPIKIIVVTIDKDNINVVTNKEKIIEVLSI